MPKLFSIPINVLGISGFIWDFLKLVYEPAVYVINRYKFGRNVFHFNYLINQINFQIF